MNYLNGLLIVFLFAGGGMFFLHAARQKDHSSMLLASSIISLGIAEIFALILNIEFFPFALKNWYFLTNVLFWGLLGTGIAIKFPQITSVKWQFVGGVLLTLFTAWGLVQMTQITGARDWYAPDRSVYTQYIDLLARNRPTRWLTSLFIFYGLGSSLLFAGYAIIQRRQFTYLLIAFGSILLAAQEYIYDWVGELTGDIFHIVSRLILIFAVLFLLQISQPNTLLRSKKSSIFTWATVILIIFLGAFFRLNAYGNICKAVLTYDSGMFIHFSRLNFFSLDFFTANRPAFIIFIYKLGKSVV